MGHVILKRRHMVARDDRGTAREIVPRSVADLLPFLLHTVELDDGFRLPVSYTHLTLPTIYSV